MLQYQQNPRYFAQIAGGLEELGQLELTELGALDVLPAYRGVYFTADQATLYRINYCSRLVTRIIAPLLTFQCHSTRYLYKTAREIPWDDFFSPDHTFAIFAHVSNSKIRHSQYAAQVLKDAIADYFRDKLGRRPNVERITPDLWFNLFIDNDKATIGLDTSGGSLHRRGYHTATIEAPMQETLAAAIIRLTQWDGSKPIYDPMCGSGTLLSEALMYHCRIPPGFLRQRFGFEFAPDFNSNLWQSVKNQADQGIRDLPFELIAGSDIASTAIAAASRNLKNLPHGEQVSLQLRDFRTLDNLADRIIVCNPPYGIRQGESTVVKALLKDFGDFLKQKCKLATAFIYLGDRTLIPNIGLKPAWKKPLVNGALDGRLIKLELY